MHLTQVDGGFAMTGRAATHVAERASELAHDAAALFHEQIAVAYVHAADVCHAIGDDAHSTRLRGRLPTRNATPRAASVLRGARCCPRGATPDDEER